MSSTIFKWLRKQRCVYTWMREEPQNPWNLFIKNCVFILTCLNFSHLQSTLHLMQYTYQGIFFHCSKQFLNSLILMPFTASAFFCLFVSTLPHQQNISPEDFFLPGETNKKKSLGVRLVNRERRAQWSCYFGQKLLNTQVCCEQVHSSITHHEMGKHIERVFKKKKNPLKPNTASHNDASWYIDTDGFLEH